MLKNAKLSDILVANPEYHCEITASCDVTTEPKELYRIAYRKLKFQSYLKDERAET